MMEKLLIWSIRKIRSVETGFKRYLYHNVQWNNRLVIITGARGVGKTTLLLQYIKDNYPLNEETLYVSLDDLYFATNTVVELAEAFSARGGKYLFLDEVHKYPNWSREVKIIYDNFPDLKLVLTGSSTLEITKGEGDLSRRGLFYHLYGLSFREFLQIKYNETFPVLSLQDILGSALVLSLEITERIKPIKYFEEYLVHGYYPFFVEDVQTYTKKLSQTINYIIETDINAISNIDYNAIINLKKLLSIIATLVPFKPNIQKLSQQIGVSRETLVKYLNLLQKADIVQLLYSNTKGVSLLNKPEKIYLHNPNLMFALSQPEVLNTGTLRETFFINQLSLAHQLTYPAKGDFLVDSTYTFEIGGAGKDASQIKGIENAWIVADHIEISVGKKIPLWLFGFVY